MTLKQFADQNGIGYNLAKQWKARGKIVAEGDGYRLVTCAPVTTVTPGASHGDGSGVTGKVTATQCDKVAVTVVTFDHAVRDLSDRITRLEDQRECRDLEDEAQWQTIKRLEGEIASLRMALSLVNKDVAKLKEDVIELYGASGDYHKRIEALEDRSHPGPGYSVTVERMAPGETLTRRRGQIDPDGPPFGA